MFKYIHNSFNYHNARQMGPMKKPVRPYYRRKVTKKLDATYIFPVSFVKYIPIGPTWQFYFVMSKKNVTFVCLKMN